MPLISWKCWPVGCVWAGFRRRCTMKRSTGRRLSTPPLHEQHLRTLDQYAHQLHVPMTHLLNLIVATALEELEQAADVCDQGETARSAVQGHAHRRHPERFRRPGDTAHTPSRAHD